MKPDKAMSARVRDTIEQDGDRLTDLLLWRFGPGHFGAILSVATIPGQDGGVLPRAARRVKTLSHVTIEVEPRG